MILEAFSPAEPCHQDFVVRNPKVRCVVEWDLPLLEKLRRMWQEMVARP